MRDRRRLRRRSSSAVRELVELRGIEIRVCNESIGLYGTFCYGLSNARRASKNKDTLVG